MEESSGNMMPTAALCDPMAVYLDDRVIVFGGVKSLELNFDVAGIYISSDTIWTFKPQNDCWVRYDTPRNQPVPRVWRASTVVIDDALYVFGGEEYNAKMLQFSNALWKLYKTKSKKFRWIQVQFDENKASQPSPRANHTCWEYDDKLWSFAGEGPPHDGYLSGGNSEKFARNVNHIFSNQLLCFDPLRGEWSIPQTRGSVPDPAKCFVSARIADKVWIYNTGHAVMYVLCMKSLVWASVEVSGSAVPFMRFPTFTAVTDTQIILHGGLSMVSREPLNDTWIFHTDSPSWERYGGKQDHVRYMHSSVKVDNKSLVVLGGCRNSLWSGPPVNKIELVKDIHWIKLEPDSLRKLSLKAVFKHKHLLQHEWESLPQSIYHDLMDMCEREYY